MFSREIFGCFGNNISLKEKAVKKDNDTSFTNNILKIFISKLKTKHTHLTMKMEAKPPSKNLPKTRKEMMMIWIVSIAFSSSFSRNWNVNKWEEIYWTKAKCVWHEKRLMEQKKKKEKCYSSVQREEKATREEKKNGKIV